MNPPFHSKRANGRIVALALLVICMAGFIATVWNYQRNNSFALSASLVSSGTPSILTASFKPGSKVQKGQRVVIHIKGDSTKARGGFIHNLTREGIATIEIDEPVAAPAGSQATVSIDGTIAPQLVD